MRFTRFRSFVSVLLLLCATSAVGLAHAAPNVLVLGDSISAGYGLPRDTGWTTLLQRQLLADHYPHTVVNASISGDTTAGGRARLDVLLAQYRPVVTILELGGNDGLRGGSLDAMRTNLDAMTLAAQKAGSKVLLVGMRVPPNYGSAYVQRFASTYTDVAKARTVPLVPFFFEGFAEDQTMFQADGIHPVQGAQVRLLDNVWPQLLPLLGGAKAQRP